MSNPSVVLISMPWFSAHSPSIALGILKSVLNNNDISCLTKSYHLAFAEHLALATRNDPRPLGFSDYEQLAERGRSGSGEWAFAVPPYQPDDAARDADYLALVERAHGADSAAILRRMRALAPGFLEKCAQEVLEVAPRIVGFSSTFSQNVASLALAQLLKARNPELIIVFGGANCSGPMGAALHRSFPWVDYVVRGEGEAVFLQLVKELLAGEPASAQMGLCLRRDGRSHAMPEGDQNVDMRAVPPPNFDEFFEQASSSPVGAELRVNLRVPYESARGCWWGAKHHCTFCGLNGSTMRFRSKPGEQVIGELRDLAQRYRALDFQVVDNIIDMEYFASLLPELARARWDLRLFFETKSNLRLTHVRELFAAGVHEIQPGIESLSSPILTLMRKGVTGLQNVRLLKWCASYGINVHWNVLYGFPGEPPEEYARMAKQMDALVHLSAPNLIRLGVDRFSPYFTTPRELGLRLAGPLPFYKYLYQVPDSTLEDLAYFFEAEHLDGRNPEHYIQDTRAAVGRWRAAQGAYRSLQCRVGPDFMVIEDGRPGSRKARYALDRAEAEIYLACDAGATPGAILRNLPEEIAADLELSDVQSFLEELSRSKLVYREGDQYVSLAIPQDADRYFDRLTRSPLRLSAGPVAALAG